jgi:hypothetical protein
MPLFLFAVLVVSSVFGWLAFDSWRGARALEERGQATTATVVEVGTGKARRVTVEYTPAGGRPVRVMVRQGDTVTPLPRVGEEIPIRYDPRDPSAEVRDPRSDKEGRRTTIWIPAFAAVAGAGTALVLGVRWLRGREPSRI